VCTTGRLVGHLLLLDFQQVLVGVDATHGVGRTRTCVGPRPTLARLQRALLWSW
jgi:hypothetical protein